MSEKKYRRMRTDIFNHPKTSSLSSEAKLLMLYLTTPHVAGVSCKSVLQMRNGVDAGKSVDVIRAALAELVAAGVAQWDEGEEVVWIVEAFDEQVCAAHERHPNMAKAVMAYLDTLPRSAVVEAFLKRYEVWLRKSGARLPGDRPVLRVIDPSPNPSGKGSGNPFGNQKQEQEQKQEQQGERVTEDLGSSRQKRAASDLSTPPRASPEPEITIVERRMIAAFERAQGTALDASAVKEAMERWSQGDATEAELLRIVDWWPRNRDRVRYLRWCFMRHGEGQWSQIAVLVLGRKPGQRRNRKSVGPPTSAMAGNEAKWQAIKSEPPPELDDEFNALPDRVGIGGDT